MRKTKLATAVSLALAGSAGMVGTAQAVNVNPDGLGEVLLFPYYTVRGGYDTLFSIVNTRNEAKAVKVRFLEGKNSIEVLDFNLYLSPFDVWTGALVQSEEGVRLATRDTSCTVPRIPEDGVEFRNFRLIEEQDGAGTDLDRTREGYVEIIEMGVVTGELATAATHVEGEEPRVPQDCEALMDAWRAGGTWAQNPSANIQFNPGGLFSKGILINVEEGVAYGYRSTALEDFFPAAIHTRPDSIPPSLNSGIPISNVFTGEGVATSIWGGQPVNAVSAVLMHDTVMNQFVTSEDINAGTDWVVSFPTKRFHVAEPVTPPFTQPFTQNGACEDVTLSLWDREERSRVDDVDFSPTPPQGVNALCWEVNVITFNNTNVLESALQLNVDTAAVGRDGWMRMAFVNAGHQMTDEEGLFTYFGLPSIGFGVQKYVNGDVNGLMSNYGGLFDHASSRFVSEAAGNDFNTPNDFNDNFNDVGNNGFNNQVE
jgi:hypothetical protein